MKKYLLLSVIVVALSLTEVAKAQVEDVKDPLLQFKNEQKDLKFTIGGRFMADAAYYNDENTPMNSGFAIVDARIRTSLTYKNFYFYADFDFSKGIFKQKNIFLQYNLEQTKSSGNQSIKAGFFAEPSSMGYNTSLYNYHFISRPAGVNALAPVRALGITYKYYNKHFFADQGVFAENKYNDQANGYQGYSVSGRWLYKPINNDDITVHVGFNARFSDNNTGTVVNDVFTREMRVQSAMETYVYPETKFLNANVPWTKQTLTLGGEALVKTNRLFARGEYIHKRIYKERPDQTLFENQLGGVWSWTTLASWQKGNPIRATNFGAAYVEAGWLILGKKYEYDNSYGILKGMNENGGLELVARYSYIDLNDINEGDVFLIGKQVFYPNGNIIDYPAASTSIGGGMMHSITVGINYSFNEYVKIMGDYKYSKLSNVYFPMDTNFNQLQLRLMFSF